MRVLFLKPRRRQYASSLPNSELEQFTLNPALAPTPVFTSRANDQAAYLLWDREATTTGSTSESRPAAADHFPVPGQTTGAEGPNQRRETPRQPVRWSTVRGHPRSLPRSSIIRGRIADCDHPRQGNSRLLSPTPGPGRDPVGADGRRAAKLSTQHRAVRSPV